MKSSKNRINKKHLPSLADLKNAIALARQEISEWKKFKNEIDARIKRKEYS